MYKLKAQFFKIITVLQGNVMLQLFTILFVVGVAVANPIIDEEGVCATETGSTVEALENYRENHEFDPEDHTLKCMVKCTLVKESFLQDDGVIDVETVANIGRRRTSNLSVLNQLLREMRQCDNSNVEGDACDKAFFFAECMINLKKNKQKLLDSSI